MTATPWALGFLLRHAADELQRALAGVLDLVALVRGHPQDVPGFNRMFALGSHHEPPAFQDVHLLLIPVIVERRGGAGLDLKDAHREVLRAALLVDHPPDFTPGIFSGCSAVTSSGRKISMVTPSVLAVPLRGDCPLSVFDSSELYDARKRAPDRAFGGTVPFCKLTQVG